MCECMCNLLLLVLMILKYICWWKISFETYVHLISDSSTLCTSNFHFYHCNISAGYLYFH